MVRSALVIGYGSIGKRHTEILQSMDGINEVSVLSRQNKLNIPTIGDLNEIDDVDPEYIVIASNTAMHFEQLRFLEDHFEGKTILVEKPLFDKHYNFTVDNNSVFVGYTLRFHPLMQLIKEKIASRKLWNANIFCGSFLPEWVKNRNYRESSSAKKNAGGGVLLDLSHELDYVQWFCGKITPEYVCNEKISDLEIDSDDLLLLSGLTESGANIHISLNYFTRKPVRQFIIDGEGISIHADLIINRAVVYEDGDSHEYSWPELQRNSIYQAEHEAVLSGKTTSACTYEEGNETMCLIDSIRTFNK